MKNIHIPISIYTKCATQNPQYHHNKRKENQKKNAKKTKIKLRNMPVQSDILGQIKVMKHVNQ